MKAISDPLIACLEDLPIGRNSLKIFLEYLCSQSGEYLNFKEVGESFNVSKQWVHQVVERYCAALNLKHKHDGTLEKILAPVTKTLARYKGAIRIEQFVQENKETLGLDEVDLRRYLRFAEIITKQLDITKDLDLFWESRSRCIKCRSFQDEIMSYQEIAPDILERIDQSCIIQNCPIRRDRKFELGQLIYYSPFHQASQEHHHYETKNARTSVKDSFDELIHGTRVDLNNTQVEFLNFICRNDCKVSQTKLAAYCGIKKIDLNPTILEINAEFFKGTGGQLITFNAAEERWELDDAVLTLSSNENTNDFEHENVEEANGGQHEKDTQTDDKQTRSILELHIEMLGNTLSNSNQSYKFYWAESLFYFMKQKRASVSFHEMAACMVAHAWDDVLIRRYHFRCADIIPNIAKRAYTSSDLKRDSSILEKIEQISSLISNQESYVLTRCAPSYFLHSYDLVEPKTRKPSQNSTETSNHEQQLYSYENNSVTFNAMLSGILLNHLENLYVKVIEMKTIYFTKIASATE